MLLHKDSIQVFNFRNEPEILKAYFCYLIYIFTCLIKEIDLNKKYANEELVNIKSETYDLNLLLGHFRNALIQSRNKEFLKILKKNSETDIAWNFIIDQLKN